MLTLQQERQLQQQEQQLPRKQQEQQQLRKQQERLQQQQQELQQQELQQPFRHKRSEPEPTEQQRERTISFLIPREFS
ncbi:MAG: hypothetical protein A2061_05815 [Gallionellales bacterium GWA2_59_43]|nr:MAG: hypothetical protein A2061_05815 [Gallionellales bacterium GWA2_59_43]